MSALIYKKTGGPLPTSTYELTSDEDVMGMIQIRHKVSHSAEVPTECASHIYYEIDEKYREQGYGKEILKLGKIEAKKLGLKKIIITCQENNIFSKKVIEANGGIYLGHCITTKGERILKYKIKL